MRLMEGSILQRQPRQSIEVGIFGEKHPQQRGAERPEKNQQRRDPEPLDAFDGLK